MALNPREKLKRELMAQRGYCHGDRFIGPEYMLMPQSGGEVVRICDCAGGLEMHEVLFTRGHAVTAAQKKYMNDARNVVLVCHVHHGQVQHSKAFRAWWKRRAGELYGQDAVDAYLRDWPTKIRARAG